MPRQDIEQVILFQIEQASRLAKLYAQQEFDRMGLGITVEQWILLKIVQEAGSLTQTELAVRTLRDPGSITRTLALLQGKGLLAREANPADRRQSHVSLTPAGGAFVRRHMSTITALRKRTTKGFTPGEKAMLTALLQKVQGNFR